MIHKIGSFYVYEFVLLEIAMIPKKKITFSLEEPLIELLEEYSNITGCTSPLLCRAFVQQMLSNELFAVIGKGSENLTDDEKKDRLDKISELKSKACDFLGVYIKYGVPPVIVQLLDDAEYEEIINKAKKRE